MPARKEFTVNWVDKTGKRRQTRWGGPNPTAVKRAFKEFGESPRPWRVVMGDKPRPQRIVSVKPVGAPPTPRKPKKPKKRKGVLDQLFDMDFGF